MNLKITSSNKEKKLRFTEVELNAITSLDNISDKLYSINTNLYNYFFEKGLDIPFNITKDIESLIDDIDNTSISNLIRPICKRAVLDNFEKEEFEEKFDTFCSEYNIINSESLIPIAIDIFEEECLKFKRMKGDCVEKI